MKTFDVEDQNSDIQEVTIPWYMGIQWALYDIALPSSFLVVIVYWGVLYAFFPEGREIDFLNVSVHGINSVLMMIEYYVGAIPTRILHAWFPLLYAFCYMIMSIILFFVDGTVLYENVVDWNVPGNTIGFIIAVFFFYIVTQFVLFVIYRALTKCAKK